MWGVKRPSHCGGWDGDGGMHPFADASNPSQEWSGVAYGVSDGYYDGVDHTFATEQQLQQDLRVRQLHIKHQLLDQRQQMLDVRQQMVAEMMACMSQDDDTQHRAANPSAPIPVPGTKKVRPTPIWQPQPGPPVKRTRYRLADGPYQPKPTLARPHPPYESEWQFGVAEAKARPLGAPTVPIGGRRQGFKNLVLPSGSVSSTLQSAPKRADGPHPPATPPPSVMRENGFLPPTAKFYSTQSKASGKFPKAPWASRVEDNESDSASFIDAEYAL